MPPPSPRAAVCRVNKSLIYLRADFQRRAELRITKYFPHMGPGRLGWRRGSGRPGNLKLSQINLNPNEAWRQRLSKISFRNTFEEIKSSQKNHLPFCLRVVQQRPAGAQRVSDLMIHTNEQFLWLEWSRWSWRVSSCFLVSSPELIITEQQSFVTSAWEKLS